MVSGSTTYYTCTTCSSGAYNDCKSCSSPAFLYPYNGGDCRYPCPDGFWGSTGPPRQCLPCYSNGISPYSCKTCNGGTSSSCLTCFSGTFRHSSQCINPCPAGYWGNTQTNVCEPCNSACATCTGPASNECLSCNSGYLYSGQCLSSCPIGYYASSKTCKLCWVSSTSPFSCRSCDNTGSSHCLSCTANSYLYPNTHGECRGVCPDGYWGDTTTWKCQPCYSNPSGDPVRKECATCFGPSATSCLTCPTGTYYFSVDKTCLSTCPPGYYANGLSNPNNLCVQCYQNNPPSSPDGTCLTCNGPYSNNCLSCGNFQYLDSTTGKCVNTCPIGYYANPTTNKCEKCYEAPYSWTTNQSCYTCTGTTSRDCTSCLPGTFLYQEDQTCLYTCPDGWWSYLPTRTCKICYQYDAAYPTVFTCATCTAGTANDCLTCNSPYFWDSTTGTCVQTCPDGYWGDSGSKTCKPCFSTTSSSAIMKTCKTCSGGNNNQCTSCNSGTYLYTNNNTCLGGCPGGWYPDTLTLSCELCFQSSSASSVPSTCATCTGPNNNQCVTCLSGFYWDPLTSTCINPCSDGYYADTSTQQCKQCFQAVSSTSTPRTCRTCLGALSTNCLSCNSGEYLLPSTSSCLSSCPAGTYPRTDINWCGNCYQTPSHGDSIEKSCATCNGWKPTNCLTCPSQTYYYPQNSTCLSSCPGGTYYDTNSLSCQPCYQTDSNYFGCLTCTGPMYTQCTSCANGLFYFAENGTCGNACPCGSGYFYNSTTKQCRTCYPGCEYCTSSNSQDDCYYTDKYDSECLLGEFEGKNKTQSMSMFVQFAGQSAYVLSMVTVVLSGATTMGAPIAFTYMGLLGLYQYLNVDYGSNAVLFFQSFFSFNSEGHLYPNYFSSSDSKYWNSDTRIQGDNKFYLYRISYLFLKNFGSKLSLLLTLVATTPILTITAMVLKNAGVKEKYLKMFNVVKTFIQWNLIITVFLSSFVPMVLSFCLELHFLVDPIAPYNIFSTTVSLIVTITAASLTLALYFYTRIKSPKYSHPNLCRNAQILANQEDPTKDPDPKSKNKYWALVSCLRSLLLVTFISTLSNYPLIQCCTALATNIAFFLGVLKFRFFDRWIKDIIIKVCEGLNATIPSLFLVHSVYEYMNVSIDLQKKMNIGWAIIGLITAVTLLTLIYQVIETVFVIKRVGTPLYSKLKAFLEYSIGKDIWKRSQKESLEITKLKTSQEPSSIQGLNDEIRKPSSETKDNLLHDETNGTILIDPSDPNPSLSERADPKKQEETTHLPKKEFPLERFIKAFKK